MLKFALLKVHIPSIFLVWRCSNDRKQCMDFSSSWDHFNGNKDVFSTIIQSWFEWLWHKRTQVHKCDERLIVPYLSCCHWATLQELPGQQLPHPGRRCRRQAAAHLPGRPALKKSNNLIDCDAAYLINQAKVQQVSLYSVCMHSGE